ncbi:MAG: phosphoribosylformylglycinamidine synthase [Patescibacteria group bacterium]|nr:phosphoribosylformylglycinamidine synthase [Patescibacteria group bacterium]MDE1965789.1 phosphoribosylformylglycinamidine synthase [Patescibacteria group bacterium]
MAARITVEPVADKAKAEGIFRALRARFPKARLTGVSVTHSYVLASKGEVTSASKPAGQKSLNATKLRLGISDLARAAEELTNPTIERSAIGKVLAPERFAHAIEIGFLPGVTDNVGATATEMIGDALGARFTGRVFYSNFVFLLGRVSRDEAARMAYELHNPLIERATVYSPREFKKGRVAPVVPKVLLDAKASADRVNLDIPDDELARIGKQGVANADGSRRGPLALSLSELRAIREHFKEAEHRAPTDIELETLAQTWSEHCKHTIFNDPLDDIGEGIYKHYIRAATNEVRKRKGKKDFCVSVFTDNSGAIAFDDEYLVTHKVETHNSPSALDPFGGAITGIVGVNRDALGFGMGAKPVANVYGYCVGRPDDQRAFYRDKERKQPMLSSRRILEGVVAGINAGGNQSGIPTPLGFVYAEPRYRGKPLVFAGTVGLIPRTVKGKAMWKKNAAPGDYIVMAGGHVGADGIHGATFSSETLESGSPATAVQIGDPITQKKLSDALVREARDAGLYDAITDDGAGGLSSSVGEMARDMLLPRGKKGGCDVDLSEVPLKYPGLAPWQIWISESQERMTLAVPKAKWKTLQELFEKRGVESTVIGRFTTSGRCVVRHGKKKLMDMDMDFLHDGRPKERQESRKPPQGSGEQPARAPRAPEKDFLALLARPNIGSYAFISDQYDHEVQGGSVTKPLAGRGRVNADAGVFRPRLASPKGVVLAQGMFPIYSDLDAYASAAAALDYAVRAAVCAGGNPDYLALLDNFCWSSGNSPERLYELKEAARACYEGAVAYGAPFISGKDSMHNDFRGFDAKGNAVHIQVPPTLLISAIGVMQDASKAVTLDPKIAGDLVYLIGKTNEEMGGSEYAAMLSETSGKDWKGGRAPRTDFKANMKAYRALSRAVKAGLVASALPVGRGGLAAALGKAAVAGGLGIEADIRKLPGTAASDAAKLFSESTGRALITVASENRKAFEELFTGIPSTRIGTVASDAKLTIRGQKKFAIPLAKLAKAYRTPFKQFDV